MNFASDAKSEIRELLVYLIDLEYDRYTSLGNDEKHHYLAVDRFAKTVKLYEL